MKKLVLMIPALCMVAACSNCAKVVPAKQEAAQPEPAKQAVVIEEAVEEPAPAIVETVAPAPAPAPAPVLAPAPAPAQQGNQQQEMPTIESIVERAFTFDANKDGRLTFDEFKASEEDAAAQRRARMGNNAAANNAAPRNATANNAAAAEQRIKDRFDRFDTNKDGVLTKEELTAGLEAQRQQMRNRPQGQGQGGGNRQGQGQGQGQGGGNRSGGTRTPRNP